MELKIPPLLLVVLSAALMYGLSRLPAGHAWQASWWLPLLPAAAGLAVAGTAAATFRRRRTTLSPLQPQQTQALVSHGIFRYSRNPMYLGMALLLASWGIYLGSLPALAGIPLFVLYLNRFQIRPEERFLTEKFGDSYRAYCRQTRRWL
ncbi:methyltransferase family protein [Neisseria shayeganii]|uniref:Isoprenylcysteine carboxyl methyltransferase n=2 Tax=Neisseria shayeganii TaxID=607712 RepID=G4CF41_9NEIS|nr:isoprenylcysteine carboxylmethyltransferase family protein [Neisseria shayeganii]EGY53579.1 isoprenylcysteine carboxyl methyltransferase [Neisseria shayeganii 871]QMT39466.1 isoprenylcysteine carboxylmethyltransferase family protein [Neisseria shayeganii]